MNPMNALSADAWQKVRAARNAEADRRSSEGFSTVDPDLDFHAQLSAIWPTILERVVLEERTRLESLIEDQISDNLSADWRAGMRYALSFVRPVRLTTDGTIA